jgi:hypothetical protein
MPLTGRLSISVDSFFNSGVSQSDFALDGGTLKFSLKNSGVV